jgi:hypothetical protein
MLFGTFFFLSGKVSVHSRNVYTVIALISEVGGIKSAFFLVFGTLGVFINSQNYMGKLISEL